MEDIRPNKIELFDKQFSNDQINMCKVLISYLPSSSKRSFAIYIKYMELQYTLQSLHHNRQKNTKNRDIHDFYSSNNTLDIRSVCDELLPYCSEQNREQLHRMCNLFTTMQNIQEMMEMMETMKALFPDASQCTEGNNDQSSMDSFSFLSGLFGTDGQDISTIMHLFNGMHATEPNEQNS